MSILRRLALVTTIAVFLLITVGAFVRASGSGLGCPDWPHCYGRWIPPTSIDQVPPAMRGDFNVWETWIEYTNRLLGFSIGLLCVVTMIAALMPEVRKHRPIVASVVTATILTGLQGLQGAKVVKTKLDPRFVTVHLFIAVVIAMLFIHAAIESRRVTDGENRRVGPSPSKRYRTAVFLGLVVSVIQLVLGALVRGSIELVAKRNPDLLRAEWLEKIGGIGTLHEGMAVVLGFLLAGLILATWTRPHRTRADHYFIAGLLVVLVSQFAAGLALVRYALPPAAQVIHVIGGSLVTALLFTQWRLTESPQP